MQRTARCRPEGLCDFELWFINRGPGPWTGSPEIVDTLPEGATLVGTSGTSICRQTGSVSHAAIRARSLLNFST